MKTGAQVKRVDNERVAGKEGTEINTSNSQGFIAAWGRKKSAIFLEASEWIFLVVLVLVHILCPYLFVVFYSRESASWANCDWQKWWVLPVDSCPWFRKLLELAVCPPKNASRRPKFSLRIVVVFNVTMTLPSWFGRSWDTSCRGWGGPRGGSQLTTWNIEVTHCWNISDVPKEGWKGRSQDRLLTIKYINETHHSVVHGEIQGAK